MGSQLVRGMTVSQVTVPPSLGRIVIYKSKIDNGPGNDVESPAIVTRTRKSTVPAVIDRWGPEPHEVVSQSDPTERYMTVARPESVVNELSSDTHVDLTVFGVGQVYREYNVPEGEERGTWHWPNRAQG